MACTVYCLISEGGQRDRVMRRLEEAGIDPDHIVMIRHPKLRRIASSLSGSSSPSTAPITTDTPTLTDILWWPLVFYTSTNAWLAPGPDRSRPTVIPLNRRGSRRV